LREVWGRISSHVGIAVGAMNKRLTREAGEAHQNKASAQDAFASRLLWRAAAFLWINPLRAARSSRLTAASFSSAEAPVARACLRAVRKAERCARLRTVAARDLRMFFLADAIFGTNYSQEFQVTGEP
jgi:hypothetical protein